MVETMVILAGVEEEVGDLGGYKACFAEQRAYFTKRQSSHRGSGGGAGGNTFVKVAVVGWLLG